MPIVRFFIDEMKKKYTEIKKSSKIRESKVKERGVKNLADYFGLTELIKELGFTEDNDWVTLDLEGQKEIKMSLATLTRFKDSKLAKYFLGDEEAKNKFSPWIKKENETRYYIGRPFEMAVKLFQFLDTPYVINNGNWILLCCYPF